VDQYSGRAVVYNVEAEQAQGKSMLLNIVRASLRRPMQFTTVSTITGTASASGTAGYSAPVNVPFRPPTNGTSIGTFPALPTWTLNGSVSGGPAFTVPVLDTQEFYQGLLKPIPGQIYDLFVQSNYPHDVLFNLFVERVIMARADCPPKDHLPTCEYDFHNSPYNETELDLFQVLGDYLADLHLSTESTPTPDIPFDRPLNVNLRLVGASPLGASSATAGGSAGSEAPSGEGAAKKYGFCFSPRDREHVRYVPEPYRCATAVNAASRSASSAAVKELEATAKEASRIKTTGIATGKVIASKDFVDSLVRTSQKDSFLAFADKPVYLSFYLRSVENIFYYLGNVVRREWAPESGLPQRIVYIKTGASTKAPCAPDTINCWPIFTLRVDTLPSPGDFLSIAYEGHRFAAAGKEDGGGYTSTVMDIVKQLLALNSSAKSLPQSSVISVVGQ
jgi:hypothetical protein